MDSCFFQEQEVLVSREEGPLNIDLLHLSSPLKISTILGYSYPLLDPIFQKGKLIRLDGTTLEENFQALITKKSSLLLDESIPINYYLSQNNSSMQFNVLDNDYSILNRYDLKCTYNSTVDANKINKIVDTLREQHVFEEILKKFR